MDPVKPYNQAEDFARRSLLTGPLFIEPKAKAPDPTLFGARTRHQELVAIRQNLRVDAINRRQLLIHKFDQLYAGIDLTSKDAIDRSLRDRRYTRAEKRAIKSTGKLVRGANDSISNIRGRLERVRDGRDIAGRVIVHRARLGGVNIRTNVAAFYRSREEAERAAKAPSIKPALPLIIEQPKLSTPDNPEKPATPKPASQPRATQPTKKTGTRVQPPPKKSGPDLKAADTTKAETKREPDYFDFEKAALSYILGQTRKDRPGVPFDRMSVESLAKMFESKFKLSEDRANSIAFSVYIRLQHDGTISTQYIPGRGFAVDSAKILEKFQKISEDTD
jgi:hypothetical protein